MVAVISIFKRIKERLRLTFFPTKQDGELRRWHTDSGDETLRLNYPLSEDALVLDLGGYKGQWSSDLFARFGCRIWVFEPIGAFVHQIRERFKHNRRIGVYACALGATRRTEKLDYILELHGLLFRSRAEGGRSILG